MQQSPNANALALCTHALVLVAPLRRLLCRMLTCHPLPCPLPAVHRCTCHTHASCCSRSSCRCASCRACSLRQTTSELSCAWPAAARCLVLVFAGHGVCTRGLTCPSCAGRVASQARRRRRSSSSSSSSSHVYSCPCLTEAQHGIRCSLTKESDPVSELLVSTVVCICCLHPQTHVPFLFVYQPRAVYTAGGISLCAFAFAQHGCFCLPDGLLVPRTLPAAGACIWQILVLCLCC